MSKKKTEHQPEPPATDPPLATTEEVQAAVKTTRKKRTPLELFSDRKQELVDNVSRTELAIRVAQEAHENAKLELEKFLEAWRSSLLGL
jgi:hypothetical protein